MIIRLFAVLLATSSLVIAQTGGPPVSPVGPQLGQKVLVLPDVDGDGIVDYAAAAPTDGSLGPNFTGRVDVYSGANDALIWWVFGTVVGEQIGHGLGLADWTGDGQDEIIIAHQPTTATAQPTLSVRQAGTGALVTTLVMPVGIPWIEIGTSIDGADLDGDGQEEILVTAAGSHSASFVFNRPPGAVVIFYAGGGPPVVISDPTADDFGRVASFTDDLDGDGIPDVVVGAPTAGLVSIGPPLNNVGLVRVLRGSTLTTWWDLWGTASNNLLGARLQALPDQDGDGSGDIALIRGITNTVGNFHVLEIYSGSTGGLVASATLPIDLTPRSRLRLLPDLDGDGGLELAIAGLTSALPHDLIDLFSLSDLRHMDRLVAPASGLGYGSDFAYSPDTDGDGLFELVVGEPQALGTSGRVSRRNLAPCLSALADGHSIHDLLFIDGSAQLPSRRIDLAVGQPFTIGVGANYLSLQPTDFIIWGLLGVPNPASVYVSPYGSFLFPPRVAAPGLPWLFCLTDSIGYDPAAIFTGSAAPWSLGAPFGLPSAMDLTLQGVTISGPNIDITNGVLLHVR